MPTRTLVMSCALIAVIAGSEAALAQPTIRVLAVRGRQAPGVPSGELFHATNSLPSAGPFVDESGNVTFWARTTSGTRLFHETGLGLAPVLSSGDSVPGAPTGWTFQGSTNLAVRPFDGEVLAKAAINTPAPVVPVGTAHAIAAIDAAALSVDIVARSLSEVEPPAGPLTFTEFTSDVSFEVGRLAAFRASARPVGGSTPVTLGVWVDRPGSTNLVVRTQQLLGTPDNAIVSAWGPIDVNSDGTIAIKCLVVPDGGGTSRPALVIANAGEARVVMDTQMTVPGYPGSVFFPVAGGLLSPTVPEVAQIDSLGRAAGIVAISPGGSSRLWRASLAGLEELAQPGDSIANIPGATILDLSSSRAAISNNAGDVAFHGRTSATGFTQAVMLYADGAGVRVPLPPGAPAPGASGATVGAHFARTLNAIGIPVVSVTLVGPGITAANDTAEYLVTPAGATLLIREGDTIEVTPGDFRTFSGLVSVGPSHADSAGANCINNRGDFVFRANFTDGSQAILMASVLPPGPPPCNLADVATAGNPDPLAGPDGFITGDDFDVFIGAYFSELRRASYQLVADVTDGAGAGGPDGFITGADFDAFIAAFFTGC